MKTLVFQNSDGVQIELLTDLIDGNQQFTDLGVQGQFTGTFDGQGFTISNLTILADKTTGLGDVGGLFGQGMDADVETRAFSC